MSELNKSEMPEENGPDRARTNGPEAAASAPAGAAPASARPGAWRAVRFTIKAIEIRLRFIAVFAAVGLVIGYWDTIRNHWDKWTRPETTAGAVASDEEFFCPMDPQVVRDGLDPGGKVPWCPICNMPLSKRKKGEPVELPPGILSRAQFSPERVQLAGLRTIEVAYQPLTKEVRTVGYVDYDESRLSRIVTRVSGYLEKLSVNKTFETVDRGEPLAEIYSPELYATARELLLAEKRGLADMAASARQRMKLFGIGDGEIDGIVRSGEADARIVIRSPQQGYVIRKDVVEGAHVAEGATLFEIADLSVVWIEADVFEKDIAVLHEGQEIEAAVEAYPGRTFSGKVALIHPRLNRETRTNPVRFELDNPGHLLRPGMYAMVRIVTPVAETEPFRSQIAERRRRPSADDPVAFVSWQKTCPVMGLPLGSMGDPVPANVDGETVFLCCQGCDQRLQASPGEYLAKLALPPEDAVLVVPQNAVMDTGSRKVVYIEREPGMFEGVEVVLGPRSGDVFPVLSGLAPGDRVATAGAFLIDAETRLNRAASATYFGASGGEGAAPPAVQPQRAREAERSSPPELTPDELKEIARLPAADQAPARAQKLCPVTGQPLGSMGVPYKTAVDEQAIFLCCQGCEPKVKANPQDMLRIFSTLTEASGRGAKE